MRQVRKDGEDGRSAAGSRVPVQVLRLSAAALLSACSAMLCAQGPDVASSWPADVQNGALPAAASPQEDPPSRVARISVLNGDVSAEPVSVDTFSAAELNQVLTSGDRVYTDTNAQAELESGQMAVRLAGGTDLSVVALTDPLAQFGLAAGSVHLRSFAITTGSVLELDTAEAAVTVLQPGDVRIDEDAQAHVTTVGVLSGQVQIDGPGISQQLNAGDRIRVYAGDPETGQAPHAEAVAATDADALDGFSGNRDDQYATGEQASGAYLNADTIGGADLGAYGSWDAGTDDGPVWFPVVAVGWRPYGYGRWRWISPWGWTWVGPEPWGFAPFHYGRWASFGGRWGWIPGPPVIRPVYAPAMVAFVSAAPLSGSSGSVAGSRLTAWFPLGPREPYRPWYHGSTLYLNRLNASNLYDRNVAEARAFFNQRAVSVYVNDSVAMRTYANRLRGTVAMPESGFAAGLPVARNLVRVPADQLAAAPLLPHPLVTPERSMVVTAPARAVPTVLARPVLGGSSEDKAGESTGSERLAGAGRALYHRAEPAGTLRPSFDAQREAMQRTDPGRPLSPQQMESLRVDRPGGRSPAREPVAHPAPAAPARAEPSHAAPPSAGKH